MKIGSPLPRKKARIEIIPLIDIMFFLLAAFMLAGLSLIRLQSIQLNLPTATTAGPTLQTETVSIAIDRHGDIYVGRQPMTVVELSAFLSNRFLANTNVPVLISGDEAASHGSVVRVLDLVRQAGVRKVSFAVEPGASER